MRISFIKNNQLRIFQLPSTIKDNFWITTLDENGNEENIINIEAVDNKWQFTSNMNITYIKNNMYMEKAILQEYCIYTIKNQLKNETYILCCLPTYESQLSYFNLSQFNKDQITIGKSDKNIISYQNKLVNDLHATIIKKNKQYIIMDNHSLYGSYVNGERVQNSRILKYGDVITIFCLKIILFRNKDEDILLINNTPLNIKVKLNSSILKISTQNFTATDEPPIYIKKEYYYKNPRFVSSLEPLNLKIDAPPAKDNTQSQSMLVTIASMLTMSMTSLITGFMTFNSLINEQKTIASALPTLVICVSMMISTILLPTINRKLEKNKRKKREKLRQKKYKEYIKNSMDFVQRENSAQTYLLRNLYPSSNECQNIILTKQVNLWSKRIDDEDFLKISVGYGNIPMKINLDYPQKHFSLDEDNLIDEVDKWGKEEKILANVPITFSFVDNYICGLINSKKDYYNYLKNIIIQLIAFHSYDELKIIILTNKENEHNWDYFRTLPHTWDDSKKFRFFATNSEEYNEINYLLSGILKNYSEAKKDNNNNILYNKRYLIITDAFYCVRNLEIINEILNTASYIGFSLLMLNDTITSIPSECKAFIRLAEKNEIFNKDYSNTATEFKIDDYSNLDMVACSKVLSNILVELKNETFSNVPDQVNILQLYNVNAVNQLNIINRWQKNVPIFNMQVPIGVDENGDKIFLDLHEKYHGPHGLIAGMTGSGKSEFLITYILSLAINYSPNEVQFAIIDYKGGGLSGAFENNLTKQSLPHIVGTVTNLDENDINRILLSIESELKNRQMAFNVARELSNNSTIDIYKYQKLYKENIVKKNVAHLFVIVDEFAEMKTQHPQFMEHLISIARIGRSLGVHLILSTQKPSGVVDNQIWSNSRFRICFRVQETSDSMEVIKRADAAALKTAGRFYLQVGYNELFKLGQSAYGGQFYIPEENSSTKIDTSINFINTVGNIIKSVDIPKKLILTDNKLVESKAILNYLIKVGEEENYKTSPLWLDKLPANIYLENLITKYQFEKKEKIYSIIGEIDSPATQSRRLFFIDIANSSNITIYGNNSLEIENLLITLTYSTLITHDADNINYYIMDFGSENLKIFQEAPQVGDIILSSDAEKTTNLLKELEEMIQQRKVLMTNVIGDFSNYYQQTGKKIPLVVVIINNFAVFSELYNEQINTLIQLTREGPRYGIIFIISNKNQTGIGYKLLQNFKTVISLRLNNSTDYYNFFGRTKIFPSDTFGRGIIRTDDIYEFQTAFVCEQNKIADYVTNTCKEIKKSAVKFAKKIKILPELVSVEWIENNLRGLNNVPIGVEKDNLEIVNYNFKKDKATMILSNVNDYLIPFTNALVKILAKIENNNIVIFDPFASLNIINAKNVYHYHENIKSIIQTFTEQLIMQNNQETKDNRNITFILLNSYNVLQAIENNSNKESFILNATKNEQSTLIFIDQFNDFKKLEYDKWFKDTINNYSGIWIGENISNQFVLKTNKAIRESQYEIKEDFGFVVVNGKHKFVKLIREKK